MGEIPHTRQAYIETFGCQMNDRDSEIMSQLLADSAYLLCDSMKSADLVVINTCSIRGKAEQKAMSLLGRLNRMKQKNPRLLVAVAGCVAQQEGERLRERMPYIDLVIGPQHIYRLPALLHQIEENRQPIIATAMSSSFSIPAFLPAMEGNGPHKKFVTIMQGCNNFCTYCVVPFTRGREVSRPVDDIINEAQHLVASGVQEITLLGQNVNSYGLDRSGRLPQGGTSFPDLLRQVAALPGVTRIRFTTSNPKDLSEDLMRCFTELDNLCPHFHLPVQSGSNDVLKRMNRKYDIEEYLDKVENLRKYRPDIALSTDIIVGFPGESDEDFEATMDLINKVRYHSSFSFKYSDRPHTKSADFADKVDEKTKGERLSRLQARLDEIVLERNKEYEGQEIELMLEGPSKTAEGQWCGRSGTNHTVNFTAVDESLRVGQIVKVKIDEACQHSLRGSLVI